MRTSNYLPTLKHHLCSSMGSKSSLLKSAAADTKNPGPTCWVVKPVLSIDWYYLSQRLDSSDHVHIVIYLTFIVSPRNSRCDSR